MTSSQIVLVAAVFLASAVEMVEALTIVVAAGVTRGWRSALEGSGAAVAVLGVLVAALGPALVHYVPLNGLRTVVGGVLLVYGLQWLRKAVLRASGYKAKHDENAIYETQVKELSNKPSASGRDSLGFTVAFKGVFLEGVEVVVIVITLGSAGRSLSLAALGAFGAFVIVCGIGAIVARHLAGVPENALKMAVGLMLTSFGTFWSAEGLGVHWPGSDIAIPALVGFYAAVTLVVVRSLNWRRARVSVAA
jgi:uncharacterized membrane protein